MVEHMVYPEECFMCTEENMDFTFQWGLRGWPLDLEGL